MNYCGFLPRAGDSFRKLFLRLRLVFPMAFGALEHRDVTEIDRVLELLVGLVAKLAFPIGERA
jgi:hypothetical protein